MSKVMARQLELRRVAPLSDLVSFSSVFLLVSFPVSAFFDSVLSISAFLDSPMAGLFCLRSNSGGSLSIFCFSGSRIC